MPDGAGIATGRLRLRQWAESDREPFAAMNGDAEVMRYFPRALSRSESDALAEREDALIAQRGWGLWATEVVDGPPFIGFVGLSNVGFDAHFTPAVEVGWRLARSFWGRGYATEAATAALRFAFDELGLDEVISFTAAINVRSIAVMERLGMTHAARDDFNNPRLATGPLRAHVLYRADRTVWRGR